VFVPLTPELAESTVGCVAETMSAAEEPFTHALKLKRHHWHSLIIPFVERAAHAATPLSVVALNEATGRVDGCMLTEDWLAPRPLAYRMNVNDEWAPVRAMFSELHMRYNAGEGQPRPGTTLRVLYFSCVRWWSGGRRSGSRARAPPPPPHTHTHARAHASPAAYSGTRPALFTPRRPLTGALWRAAGGHHARPVVEDD
jgi:hypothetical protein